MDTFNFKRFAQVLKWYLVQNKDTLLRWSAGSAIGMFLFQMVSVISNRHGSYDTAVNFSVGAGSFLLGIAVLVAASSIFDFAKTKQRRIALLSLPASNGEKYASALVYSLIVWPLCMVLAFVVGDLLRASLMWLIGLFMAEGHAHFYSGLPTLREGAPWLASLLFLAFNLWIVSLYVLGGSLLRRAQFVITSGILFCFYIITLSGLYNLVDASENWIAFSWNQTQLTKSLLAAGLLLLAVMNFWLSYRCFCRMQVVSGKWLNVSLHR